MSVPQKYLGGYSELLACAYLLRKGYDVFRNVCDKGPVDIIAMHRATGEIRKFDVKTSRGHRNVRLVKGKYEHLGIEIIYVNPETGLVTTDLGEIRVSYGLPRSPRGADLAEKLDSQCRV